MFHNSLPTGCLVILFGLLSGCANALKYNSNDLVNANRIVTEKVPVQVLHQKVNATFGYENNPEVLKAYQAFTKNGNAKAIHADGFITLAYDNYSHPIIACEPLRLCVVQLERKEMINDIELGDAKHWMVEKPALVGMPEDGSYQIAIRPKLYDIATDLVITTNKRTYNIGLVSKKGFYTHVVNFYYPEEAINEVIQQSHQAETENLAQQTITDETNINLSQINFNYTLTGDKPLWRPIRAFDDGHKTFIEMPSSSEQFDLPVLYVQRNKETKLINYRYKEPYFVIDGLFEKAYLFSGSGRHHETVLINNRSFS